MNAREKKRIKAAADELRSYAAEIEDVADRENLLNRADALDWVLSIAE